MKLIVLTLAVSALLAVASGQGDVFQSPGVIIPGLTIEYLIEKAGGFWSQPSLIKSYNYACTDILPELEQKIPELASLNISQISDPICEKVSQSVNDPEGFDATDLCNSLVGLATSMAPSVGGGMFPDFNNMTEGIVGRKRRQAMSQDQMSTTFLLETLSNVTMTLYGIDINDPTTICPNADKFLDPSLPNLLLDFATELGAQFLDLAKPMCQDWTTWLTDLGLTSDNPFYQLAQDSADIGAQAMGYTDRAAICVELLDVLKVSDDSEARKMFVRDSIKQIFMLLSNSNRCQTISNRVIEDIIEPLINQGNDGSTPLFQINDQLIHQYTGLTNVAGVCNAMADNFEDNYIEGGKATMNKPAMILLGLVSGLVALLI